MEYKQVACASNYQRSVWSQREQRTMGIFGVKQDVKKAYQIVVIKKVNEFPLASLKC